MITFDFAYYRPTSIGEAVKLYLSLKEAGKNPLYYAGGTEIITMARMNKIMTQAVIDIKGIAECNQLGTSTNTLSLGAALTLTQLAEKNVFPLLTQVIRKLADHTSRNKITLGGNICGKIIYREALLPFLLCDSQVVIANDQGASIRSIHEIYNAQTQQLQLVPGEFIVALQIERTYLNFPYQAVRKTAKSKIDYPLLMVAALKTESEVRLALSGLLDFPFRSQSLEQELNRPGLNFDAKISNALAHLPGPVLNDLRGSADYRLFVLRNTLRDLLLQLEGVG